MANEKLMDKVMSEEDLELVAGGAGYAYIMKRKDGKYDVVGASGKLTPAQVKGILAGKPPAALGITKSISTHFHVGVQADKLDLLKKKLNKVYKGCKFQNM